MHINLINFFVKEYKMDDAQFLEELKKDFFDEAKTLIDILESNILILEKDFDNQEAINEIFRSAHTLKGGSATLDLDRIANFTHEMESLLDEIRSDNVQMSSEIVDILLKAIDIVKELIDASLNDKDAPSNIEMEIIKEMKAVYQLELSDEAKAQVKKLQKEIANYRPKIDLNLNEYDRFLLKSAPEEGNEIYQVFVLLNKNNPMKTVSGIQIHSILKEFSTIVKSIPDLDDLFQDKFYKEVNFLILSKKPIDYIKEKITISDVTEFVDVSIFEETESVIKVTEPDRIKSSEIKLELNTEQLRKIDEANKKGLLTHEIRVLFDETNPMRSVSGLLIYTILTSHGKILYSNPSFQDFKEDRFYEAAIFIISTKKSENYIKSHIYISDVTKSITIKETGTTEEAGETRLKVYDEKETTKIENEDTEKKVILQTLTKESRSAAKKTKQQSQILRVDSRRIDELFNLVSQLVIEKGNFTIINDMSLELYELFNSTYSSLKKELQVLYEEIMSNPILSTKSSSDDELFDGIELEDGKEEKLSIKSDLKSKFDRTAKFFDKLSPKLKEIQDKIKDANSQFAMVTNNIHESVMKIRMVPISQLFQRFPRLVRDLSKSLNKDIELVTQGEETELDKNTIENLVNPLIHIIRNAIDHGIENPEERIKKKKPQKGKVELIASQEGNLVVITVKDDGKGLNLKNIKEKAAQNGLIDSKMELSDQEIIDLIFLPGFSTSQNVSNLSGRGVGMDVVKKAIETERGYVDVSTEIDKGTTFTLKLPLTMAIIQALQVKIAGNVYCIPINSIIETARLKAEMIEKLEGNEVVRLREEIISVIRLSEIFNLKQKEKPKIEYLIFVSSGNNKLALVVDQLINEDSVVIKPLNNKYVDTLGITGASILGDGSVALIIEINGIMELLMKEKRRKFSHLKI